MPTGIFFFCLWVQAERFLFHPFESLAILTKKERSTWRHFFLFGGEQGIRHTLSRVLRSATQGYAFGTRLTLRAKNSPPDCFLRADPHGFESNKVSVKKKKMPMGTFFFFGGEQGIRTLEPF